MIEDGERSEDGDQICWGKRLIYAHKTYTKVYFPDFRRGLLSDGVHPERHEALVHPSSSTKTQPPYILKMA